MASPTDGSERIRSSDHGERVVVVLESPLPSPRPARTAASASRPALALALLVLTALCTATLGPAWRSGLLADTELPLLLPATVKRVWTSPDLLIWGLSFSFALLTILGAHELGHWLVCRRLRLHSTLPYFLPAPFGLGTLGAFIRIRGRIETRQRLFDVGVSGPLLGFVALLPFLWLGISWSEQITTLPADHGSWLVLDFGLAVDATIALLHPEWGHDPIVALHPFALAAWVGLLVTALNLLPLGQLDGGHILYAVSPRAHRRLAPVFLLALLIAGWFYWQGWWLWIVIVLVLGRRHPSVYEEGRPLGRTRLILALFAGLLFVLCFTPTPAQFVTVAP